MLMIQRLATTVGLAGLIPFVAGALVIALLPADSSPWAELFYLYSAGILAFMAGVYWPVSLQLGARTYPVSPLLTLLLSQGFFLLAAVGVLLPLAWQSVWFPLAYLGLFATDRWLMNGFWPAWYLRLRAGLTGVAVLAQIVVALAGESIS